MQHRIQRLGRARDAAFVLTSRGVTGKPTRDRRTRHRQKTHERSEGAPKARRGSGGSSTHGSPRPRRNALDCNGCSHHAPRRRVWIGTCACRANRTRRSVWENIHSHGARRDRAIAPRRSVGGPTSRAGVVWLLTAPRTRCVSIATPGTRGASRNENDLGSPSQCCWGWVSWRRPHRHTSLGAIGARVVRGRL